MPTSANEPLTLTVEELTVDYGGGPVVHEISFDVKPGEIVTLLGANGAGRTSTINAICGFAKTTGGTVTLGERNITRISPEMRSRAGIHVVPENRGLIPSMTVDQHVRLALRRRPRKGELDATWELFPKLASRRKASAGNLSGGEAQMLSMALALLGSPRVVLIDELSFGLAPIVVKELLQVCREIVDQRGFGILLVEQFVDSALAVADRAVVMANGSIVSIASSEEMRGNHDLLSSAYLGASDHAL